MINGGAFSQGFMEHREGLKRSRREMADAFNQFAQQNPGASLQEFQSFIDQFSGGSNYIRGGAPSGEVLRNVVSRGNERATQERMMQNMRMLNERAQIMGQLQASAQQFVSGAEISELPQRYNQFAQTLFGGEVPEEYSHVAQFFDPEYVQQQRGLAAGQALPKVIQVIEMLPDDQLNEANVARLVPELQGQPGSVVRSLISQAQDDRAQRAAAIEQENALRIRNTTTELTRQLNEDGVRDLLAFGDIDGAQEAAKAAYDQYAAIMGETSGFPDFETFFDQYRANAVRLPSRLQQENFPILVDERNSQRRSATASMEQEYIDGIAAQLTTSSGEPGPMVMGEETLLSFVMDQAQRNYMTEEDVARLYDHLNAFVEDPDDPPPVAEMLQEAANFFQNNSFTSLQDQRRMWSAMASAQLPELPEIQTMESFEESSASDLRRTFQQFEERIEELARTPSVESYGGDAPSRDQLIAQLEEELRLYRVNRVNYFRQAQANARGDRGWLAVGSRYDQTAFDRLEEIMSGLDARVERLLSKYRTSPWPRPETRGEVNGGPMTLDGVPLTRDDISLPERRPRDVIRQNQLPPSANPDTIPRSNWN